jgi:hypothetical protein
VTRFVLGRSGGQQEPDTGGGGGAVHVATIWDGCDRGGFDEAGGVEAYTARLETAGSETVGALFRSESERGGRCTRWCTMRSCRGRSGCRHGAAHCCKSPAVDVAYGHALAGLSFTRTIPLHHCWKDQYKRI